MSASLRMVPAPDRSLPPWSIEFIRLRRAAGLTQLEAAVRYGVDERTYRRWENGEGNGRMLSVFLAMREGRAA